ncbi:MAG TPA: hypothetical protein VMH90_00845, partial [Thermoplasmata archaeon]|nr:hypothetical protein [Thermoplasmata archaeon]
MARAVRIARAEAVGGSGGPAEAAATGGFTPNLGGLTRAGRLFALFVVLLGASYAVFLGLLFGGPAPNSSAVAPSIELLTALAALLLVSAFWITLARTPRGVERRTGRLV